jgi:hypothetical protein
MRFENTLDSGTTFYYELSGKQEDKLFVARFSYGRRIDEKSDFQFHIETTSFKTFDELQDYLKDLQTYCKSQGHTKVKSTKRNVST